MLNFDRNNDAVFAGATGNGADLAVVVGRDHRCPAPRLRTLRALKPSGKRRLTTYGTTPAVSTEREYVTEDMSMSSVSSLSWRRQPQTASDARQAASSLAPAIWAALRIQQAL